MFDVQVHNVQCTSSRFWHLSSGTPLFFKFQISVAGDCPYTKIKLSQSFGRNLSLKYLLEPHTHTHTDFQIFVYLLYPMSAVAFCAST